MAWDALVPPWSGTGRAGAGRQGSERAVDVELQAVGISCLQ